AIGDSLHVAMSDDVGHTVKESWPGPLQAARTQALTLGTVREQIGRLGETPFQLDRVELDLPEPVMVPRSVLNDLRRRLAADLVEKRRLVHQFNAAGSAWPRFASASTNGRPK